MANPEGGPPVSERPASGLPTPARGPREKRYGDAPLLVVGSSGCTLNRTTKIIMTDNVLLTAVAENYEFRHQYRVWKRPYGVSPVMAQTR
jgi:hypothetical protein